MSWRAAAGGLRPGPARLLVLGAAICFATTGTAQALGPDGVSPVQVGAARVGLGEWALTRRPPGARWVVATALAALGVVVLAAGGGGGAAGSLDPLGIAASLGAGASYAVCTLASKRLLLDGHGPDAVMGMLFGVAAVLLTPVLLAAGTAWLATAGGAATALFLAVVPTALAYVLFVRGLQSLPAAEVATLTLAEPVTAAALGVLLLAEPFGLATAVGSGVLVAGLVVLATGLRRTVPACAPAAPGPGEG